MRTTHLPVLLRDGVMDPATAALSWLLIEGGVPIVVTGPAPREFRQAILGAMLSIDPTQAWVTLDADAELPTTDHLTAIMRGGVSLGLTLSADDLRDALDRLTRAPNGLPGDAVRRLSLVFVADVSGDGVHLSAVHYLRPAERDALGHVQRRPPAVLTAWDEASGADEHYAWAITPELADRVDRSQADFEERLRDRAAFLAEAARDGVESPADWEMSVRRYLASEPPRIPAPRHPAAAPSPFQGGLTDPHEH